MINLSVNLDAEKFADHIVLLIILGLVEKDNPNFLLNSSAAWKELISDIETKNMKIKLMQRFFKIKSVRRQKFKRIQEIFYDKNKGHMLLNILNNDMYPVSENNNDNIIDSTIEETLRAVTTKDINISNNDLNNIKKIVKKRLQNRRII